MQNWCFVRLNSWLFFFFLFLHISALKKGRFWITPDPYHKDDNIQIGREVKISCQVEAVPSEELTFSWFKNGRPLRSSERMVITQTDPDVSPGTTNLDIIDLKFTDFGTYTCVASLKGGGISDISIDVNISSSTGKGAFSAFSFVSVYPDYSFHWLLGNRGEYTERFSTWGYPSRTQTRGWVALIKRWSGMWCSLPRAH